MDKYQSILDNLSNEIFSIFKEISYNFQTVLLPSYEFDGCNVHKLCVDIISDKNEYNFTESIYIPISSYEIESVFIKHNIKEILQNIKVKVLKLIDNLINIKH